MEIRLRHLNYLSVLQYSRKTYEKRHCFLYFENLQFRKPTQAMKLHSILNAYLFAVMMVGVFMGEGVDLLELFNQVKAAVLV